MLAALIKIYETLSAEQKRVVHQLAQGVHCLNKATMQQQCADLPPAQIGDAYDYLKKTPLLHTASGGGMTLDNDFRVWVYPLITFDRKVAHQLHSYHYSGHDSAKILIKFLNALVYDFGNLADRERELFASLSDKILCLKAMLAQPRYFPLFSRLSPNFRQRLSQRFIDEMQKGFGELSQLCVPLAHLSDSEELINNLRATIAQRRGDFSSAPTKNSSLQAAPPPARSPLANSIAEKEKLEFFNAAMTALIADDLAAARENFEAGLKKQRSVYPQTFLPLIHEFAFGYILMLIAQPFGAGRDALNRIRTCHSLSYDRVVESLRQLGDYITGSAQECKYLLDELRIADSEPVSELWRLTALAIIDEKYEFSQPELLDNVVQYLELARKNGYLFVAYEAAFATRRLTDDPRVAGIYAELEKHFGRPPLLTRLRQTPPWEKQLEQLAQVLQRTASNGNATRRIAYRFFPRKNEVQVMEQTRRANGAWTPGREVSPSKLVTDFDKIKTEQDRRVAETMGDHYYYFNRELPQSSFGELVGHPLIFLERTDTFVEFVAAKPTLSITKKSGEYRLKCDLSAKDLTDTDPERNWRNHLRVFSPDVAIKKETNTRYRIYRLTETQKEIINAVEDLPPIPEAGLPQLQTLLGGFSAHLHVQSETDAVATDDDSAREVVADPRLRLQLLPSGAGLKGEFFVKPFGDFPPYCSPGRGGKILLTVENNERLRVARDLKIESANYNRVLAEVEQIDGLNFTGNLIDFDNPLDSLELLAIAQRFADTVVVEWPEGEKLKIRRVVNAGDLNWRVTSGADWFGIEGDFHADEKTVWSMTELLEKFGAGHGRFIEIGKGEFVALSEQLQRALAEFGAFSASKKDGVKINRFAAAALADTFDNLENLKLNKAWREFRARLNDAQANDAPLPTTLQAELRPYQTTAYQWLTRLAAWGAGACLADDMGLGKTVETLAALLQRANLGPALVVAPLSVAPNWLSEAQKFAPSLNVKNLRDGDRGAILSSLSAGDVLVSSYGLLLAEGEKISAMHWATAVLDEAHTIKNFATKTSQVAMTLQADFKIALTGTPVQNHLGEIWNLFQFINPGLLGSRAHFTENFVNGDETARQRLKKLLTPFILRRTKTAVLEELPAKTEIVKKIELSDEERAFYEALRRRALANLADDKGPVGAQHLKTLAEITRLRQACCHPQLVEPKAKIASTKLATFLEIVAELKDNGHRALVFSQFVTHLAIVKKALDDAGFSYQYLDGATSSTAREKATRDFQNGVGDLFLISLKAGGLGLNLTAADYVIHLDPWWNPAIEDQASDRAHRIGQARPVTVYRLVVEQTIEEKILALHHTKRDLADSLLSESDRSGKLSLTELLALIKEA